MSKPTPYRVWLAIPGCTVIEAHLQSDGHGKDNYRLAVPLTRASRI